MPKKVTPSLMMPKWINQKDWDAFVAMRKTIKKPMSSRAMDMAIRALIRLKGKGEDPNLVLQFAEYKNNQGLFPVPAWFKDMIGYEPPESEEQRGAQQKKADDDYGNY